jgi:indolepyruvate ferredoxin oxidoreductase
VNEDLAATACWGTQQLGFHGETDYDGVFAIWYGKGPGVDRTGDVFRHANMAGVPPHGGVLALMGDDHTAESSTIAHQTEFLFVDIMSPILHPAGVQELIDYGLHGYAMSRFSGSWIAFKCLKETIESTASVDGSLDRLKIVIPEFELPPGGLNIRLDEWNFLEQEARLHEHRREAAIRYVRANHLNRIVFRGGRKPKLGIVTVGKSYLDVRQALDDIGIDEVRAADLGIRLLKVACPWPLDPIMLMDFVDGLDMAIVVEEKRSLIEVQVREELYGTANQPQVVGKKDEGGRWLFPVKGALDPNDIAIGIGERILRVIGHSEEIAFKVSRLRQFQEMLAQTKDAAIRSPYFCSGCPHNSSTKVPDGMRAQAGIGCHFMAVWMNRNTTGFTAMGGEGANWIGEAPFSNRAHVIQNLGDGTYNHSGSLALRWAVDTKTNITYKILFNDAVAMTGGQKHEGGLTVDMIARQVAAEGVSRIALVSDDIEKYPATMDWPKGMSMNHRDDLETVTKELATTPGVTVLLYDQTCAAEKRRRRKRGEYPDPDKRVIINELVCEGCGDCGVASNCVSVQPLETEFGRKRRIDQSSCNKDFSCVNGFCPSFVTVHGAKIRKAEPKRADMSGVAAAALPEPKLPDLKDGFACIVTGIGGTGVVTIGAIIGMAAHLEGKGCGMIDMAGLAQKGGAVFSHIRLAETPEKISAIRVNAGKADLVLGCDLVVSGAKKVLSSVRQSHTAMMVNTAEVMPGDFARNADFSLPTERLKRTIAKAAGEEKTAFVDATSAATAILGNAIAANMFMLGFAWQKCTIPLSREALAKAIELNGEAVKMNLEAFAWGRRAAAEPETIAALLRQTKEATPARHLSQTLDEMIARRVAFLTDYQDAAYAARYRALVDKVRAAEKRVLSNEEKLATAVARYLFKLMAIKDEYEVARLYTDGSFQRQVDAAFEGNLRYEFHLAPPILGRKDPNTGLPRKTTFGPWMMKAFGLLARMKGLRGTRWDIFGRTEERKRERALIGEYEALLAEVLDRLSPDNHATAVALASIPEKIRGFGHVKERHLNAAKAEEATLLQRFREGLPVVREAA